MKFADLHAHLHMRIFTHFYTLRDAAKRRRYFHPWTVISDNRRKRDRGRRAGSYTQSDLVKAWNAEVGICFNALYPLEKGFVEVLDKNMTTNALERFFQEALGSDSLVRDFIQSAYLSMPLRTLNFFQSDAYDYFDFLQEEYRFITNTEYEGQEFTSRLYVKGIPRQIFTRRRHLIRREAGAYQATGKYHIPKNKAELQHLLANPRQGIIMPLTIEGAHALNSLDFLRDDGSYDSAGFRERILAIKRDWQHPIFFITLAHHFFNGLCGHAHSIPKIIDVILNQDRGKDEGLYPQGEKAIRCFLGIDDQGNDAFEQEGYRILIDVKHMSAAARAGYYDQIVRKRLADGLPKIPVIASHCCYMGVKTLAEAIANAPHEKNRTLLPEDDPKFYAWNINLTDEDIRIVFESEGIIGLSFDQRVAGVHPRKKIGKLRNNIEALFDNLIAILNVIYEDPGIPHYLKRTMWERVGIGTDFDGYIDPIDPYSTFLHFRLFRRDMKRRIQKALRQPTANIPACLKDFGSNFTIDKALDLICVENAKEFLERHYPDPR